MREKQEKRGNEGTNGSGRWEEGVEMRVRGDGRVEGGGWRVEGKARGCVPQARFDQESLARCHVREQHAPAVPCTYGRDGATESGYRMEWTRRAAESPRKTCKRRTNDRPTGIWKQANF